MRNTERNGTRPLRSVELLRALAMTANAGCVHWKLWFLQLNFGMNTTFAGRGSVRFVQLHRGARLN